MALFNNKIIKELQQENEMLKTAIKHIEEREEKIRQLEIVQKRMQSEVVELGRKKKTHIFEIENLREKIEDSKKILDGIKSELKSLQSSGKDKSSLSFDSIDVSDRRPKDSETTVVQFEIEEELKDMQKRKDKLTGENILLEETIREMTNQIQQLKLQKESLEIQIDKIKSDKPVQLETADNETIDKLTNITEKIESLKTKGKIELSNIQSRIEELTMEENAIRDRINLRMNELEEIENSTSKGSSGYKQVTEDNLLSLVVEEQNLIESIEKKQQHINQLEEKVNNLKQLEQKASNDFDRRLEKLQSKEIELKGNINLLKLELEELKVSGSSKEKSDSNLIELKTEEQNLLDKISQLTEAEQMKLATINELNDKLAAKEMEFAALSHDLDSRSVNLNELQITAQKIEDEVSLKQKELLAIVQTINSKSDTIKSLRSEIEGYQEKLNALKSETENYEKQKSEFESRYKNKQVELDNFSEEKKKIAELIPALEKRKLEMLQGNKALEERFTDLFQQLNREINQANQKKNVLEQIIQKKEKDLEEKDQMLNEKMMLLEESERSLNLRQAEIDSFDELLKTINEQKELLKNDLGKLDDTASEKRIVNKDLRMETDFLQKKMQEIEKSIHDLLSTSDVRLQKSIEKRKILDNEIHEYEDRLNDLNIKIKDSMNELVDLRTSISRIKLEHEEHRISLNKFASIKKKLDEDIKKNQILLNKYKQIREKIKIEQTTMARLRGKDSHESESDYSEIKSDMLAEKNNPDVFKP